MSVGQPAGTAFIQEVDVFNEETEERNHNLQETVESSLKRIQRLVLQTFLHESCAPPHLLLAAVCSFRPLGGTTERRAVVAEITGWIHLMLNEITQRRRHQSQVQMSACKHKPESLHSYLQDFKLVSVDFAPGLLQSGDRVHVHPS